MGNNLAAMRHDQWEEADFIKDDQIWSWLKNGKAVSHSHVLQVIEKARQAKGLTPQEAAILLQVEDVELLAEVFAAAKEVKQKIYGKRVVVFAPLYVSDHCVNSCTYCGYQQKNIFKRRKLSMSELKNEVEVLENLGHKRLALEAGEHPTECSMDYILECLSTIYGLKFKNGSIRRINVNVAATSVQDYARLKKADIGTYILFQETYHRETYKEVHPAGPKADYDWHTTAHDRAMEAGIDDVGFGVLFGLYDFKYEVLAMLQHALHLEERFGVGPHTISVPRLRPAEGMDLSKFPHLVTDDEFARLIAVIRLAVPYTGLILSTRERPELRDKLLDYGISQISAGSCTGVGGYRREDSMAAGEDEAAPQFSVDDHRSPDEVLKSVCGSGYLPSYCTACYRQGRTGDRFMALAKNGQIQNVCQPNALLTFKEYLLDYASPDTRAVGEKTIRLHLEEIENPKVREVTAERLARIERGERDLYL
ncbi:[FeFe] hydrogenase H-cluster radical SAM maturase HydG [Dethiobacter alkaliphilus]|uniref:[FeFe] hydrogenase H-cluster radical SAM maturase HydG n=1 Tax=Dethiobacter alkaliphilus TaxID=427926 RepID=UPI0022264D44|nr:[FeFe] hydrogenase H-cluster radical SAM maturase HydG [Dethiobacter alkaliphilus]MCW3490144.1 [FeFe] hydrogenase H-cluster radical SAM maturase HydG [Dethiobacter alkaliphilus]